MSRTSQNSHADSRRIGASILARIPAACRNAFDTLGLAGRSPSAAPPFARKILFEALEPRLLLSADLNPAATSLNPQDQPSNDFAVSSTYLSLSDDPATSGLAVVRVSGPQEPVVAGDGRSPADWWRLDLKQGDIVSLSVDTPESDMDPYLSLSDASGREIASDNGPGNDALISGQEVLMTGTYYVQVRPSGDGAQARPYELRVERTLAVQRESEGQVGIDPLADANPGVLAADVGSLAGTVTVVGSIVAPNDAKTDAQGLANEPSPGISMPDHIAPMLLSTSAESDTLTDSTPFGLTGPMAGEAGISGVTIQWLNPAGGDWNNTANWEGGRLPTASDIVLINADPGATITLSSGSVWVQAIETFNSITLDGGVLRVDDVLVTHETISLFGGTIEGGTVRAVGGGGVVVAE